MIPWQLFTVAGRDLASPVYDYAFRWGDVTSTALIGNIFTSWRVPPERMLLLMGAYSQVLSGAGQTTSQIYLAIGGTGLGGYPIPIVGVDIPLERRHPPGNVAEPWAANSNWGWEGPILVPGGTTIGAAWTSGVPVTSAQYRLGAFGIFFPRGNIGTL